MAKNFWKKLKKPACAGRPIMALAPMSGVTDKSFRLMLLKLGRPDVFWTEFVSADGLLSERGEKYCLGVLEHSKKEKPIVAQLFGGNSVNFEKAAKIVAELGFDGIDINMGCPDSDIEKRGGGASLIKNSDLAKEIIRATKKGAGKVPVSVKTRIGYEKNQIAKWIPELLKENIAALTVHLRTRNEMYRARAHWELAKEIVKLRDKYAPETLILGNGDVESLPEARKLVKETGLDGIMVGRGVLKNPWFFSERLPSVQERLDAVLEHAEIFESKNFDAIKKYFHAYVKNFKGAKELRDKLMKVKNTAETKKAMENFPVWK
jgi:nifR3 family TIM-barrel protein